MNGYNICVFLFMGSTIWKALNNPQRGDTYMT